MKKTTKWNSSSKPSSGSGAFAKELTKHAKGELRTPDSTHHMEHARQRAYAKSKESHSKYVYAEGSPDMQSMKADLRSQMSKFRKTKV